MIQLLINGHIKMEEWESKHLCVGLFAAPLMCFDETIAVRCLENLHAVQTRCARVCVREREHTGTWYHSLQGEPQ